jgi:hypothetical protein
MTLDLTDDETRAGHFRHALEYDRLDPLKAILAKLDPPQLQAERFPSLKGGDVRTHRMTIRRQCAR